MPRAIDLDPPPRRAAYAALGQLLRFGAVGLTCLALSTTVLAGLHSLAGVNIFVAYSVAFVVGNLAGYLLNAHFTFAVRSVSHVGALRYMLVNATLLSTNTLVLEFLVHRAHIWYISAAVLLGVLTAPISFLAQRIVTYRLRLRRNPQSL